MKNFVKYAQYFNHFYKDKDYKKEAEYVDSLIRRYAGGDGKSLLDVGCGTGSHDFCFLTKGYRVSGVDQSPEMIAMANNLNPEESRIRFYVAQAHSFALKDKFDAAVSLFHVMSYLSSSDTLIKSLKNIHRHLKKGGVFIFDFWYGPAVLAQRPELKIKIINSQDEQIKRIARPKLDVNANTVDIRYEFAVKNKKTGQNRKIFEHHIMRYFFLPELYLILKIAGFKVAGCLEWMSLKKTVSEKSWSGVIVAKK